MNIDRKLQEEIMRRHLAKGHHLLEKTKDRGYGISSDEITLRYELEGWSNNNKSRHYLPYFSFGVETACLIPFSDDLVHPDEDAIDLAHGGIRTRVKSKHDGSPVDVYFKSPKDLFELRNLTEEGNLLSIIQSDKRDHLPFNKRKFFAGFYLEAHTSEPYKYIHASMGLGHPYAEKAIKQFLETIDKRFEDYRVLKRYHRRKDKKGKLIEEMSQSKKYKEIRNELHDALFKDLKKVFRKNAIPYVSEDMSIVKHIALGGAMWLLCKANSYIS